MDAAECNGYYSIIDRVNLKPRADTLLVAVCRWDSLGPPVVTADFAGMTFTVELAKWILPPNGFLGASTGCNGQKRGEDECEYGDSLHRGRRLAHRLAVFGQERYCGTAIRLRSEFKTL